MAITLLAVVVVPRLLLAGAAFARYRRAAGQLSLNPADSWVQVLGRQAPARARTVTVLPYNCRDSAAAAGLTDALIELCGAGAQPRTLAVLPLGAEDDLPTGLPQPLAAPVVVLMDAAATPERETHGAFLQRLRPFWPDGAELRLLLDSGGLLARMRGQPDAAQRLAQRTAAWTRMAEAAGWPAPVVRDVRNAAGTD
jgi:hypothetical protein